MSWPKQENHAVKFVTLFSFFVNLGAQTYLQNKGPKTLRVMVQ